MIARTTKTTASHLVVRVRKSAAPRALISPPGLPPPPMPRPPPSERCISTTPTSAAATIAWTTVRKRKSCMRTLWLGVSGDVGAGPGQGKLPSAVGKLRGRDDDPEEALGRQAGTADERAADLVGRQQLGRVVGLDRAAVENPHLRAGVAVDLAELRTDRAVHRADVLDGRRAPGTDRPDRLVG